MRQLSEEQQKKIVATLKEHGVKLQCPMCNNTRFDLLDGYFNEPIQKTIPGHVLGGPSIPSVGIVCTQCGFISHHALGALGLMPLSGGTERQKAPTNEEALE